MIFVPTVRQEQAAQAVVFERRGWTHRDIGSAMGWCTSKVSRVLRLYAQYGLDIFAENNE